MQHWSVVAKCKCPFGKVQMSPFMLAIYNGLTIIAAITKLVLYHCLKMEIRMSSHTVTLTKIQDEIIERVMKLCDLKDKDQVLTEGLLLLSWAAVEANLGMSIGALHEKSRRFKEVQTAAIMAAKRNTATAHAESAPRKPDRVRRGKKDRIAAAGLRA
jgi:hypothetical protein